MEKFDKALNQIREVGFVQEIVHSLVHVNGLPGVRLGEMVILETGQEGQVTALREGVVEVLLFSRDGLRVGMRVARTGLLLTIEVGEQILGKTLGVLGDGSHSAEASRDLERRAVDVVPLGISSRKKIGRSLETGVTVVDLMIPLGMGQRELVMGDRKTGKSTFLLQAVLAQVMAGNVCVYAMIGKKKTDVKKVEEFFAEKGIAKNVVIVAASSHASTGEIFLTPFTAMTVAEYFRDRGRNVLLVLDDMTTHAKFYRELALLGRRFPGRDSYPGDIFYVHSRLLERAGNFIVTSPKSPNTSLSNTPPTTSTSPAPAEAGSPSPKLGEGYKEVSITCLVVADTVLGDVSGYIQTNLMSMTDGHIYFDSELFFRGRRPAINPFISVTRVGHQTQTALRREIGQEVLNLLANYEKTQSFLRFGAELGESSRQVLNMGAKILKFFDQPQYSVIPVNLQVVLVGLLWFGLWDGSHIMKFVQAYTSGEIRETVDQIVVSSPDMKKLQENMRGKAERLMGVLT